MATIEARGYANKVTVKTSKAGKVYKTFSLGVKQKEKAWGDRPEVITWANFAVTDFSETEVPERSYVTVKGYLNVREFTDASGAKRQSLDVNATEIEVAEPLEGSTRAVAPAGGSPSADPWD